MDLYELGQVNWNRIAVLQSEDEEISDWLVHGACEGSGIQDTKDTCNVYLHHSELTT